jgi:hypothetical protein
MNNSLLRRRRHRDSDGNTVSCAKEKGTTYTATKSSSGRSQGKRREAASQAPRKTAAKRKRDPKRCVGDMRSYYLVDMAG